MVVLEVIILIFLLLTTAFVIGKKLGQRKHLEVLKQMKALELKYENMVDDMEKSAIHCSDIIGTETDKFIELLNILDEKCLFANDIISNLDETAIALKQSSITKKPLNTNLIQTNDDKAFKDELKEALTTMFTKIVDIEDRIDKIESKQEAVSSTIKDGAKQDDRLNSMHFELQNLVAKLDKIDRETNSKFKSNCFASDQEMCNINDYNSQDTLQKSISETSTGILLGTTVNSTPDVKSEIDTLSEILKDSDCINEVILPESTVKLARPTINDTPKFIKPSTQRARISNSSKNKNSIVDEVLKQIEDGVAIPQIARSLGIGKGEIDLILNIYGNTKMKGNMQKCL